MARACDNPFAVHRILRERYRLDETEWTDLFRRLDARRRRGALVGPQGAGKTTLLEDLAGRLEARGWRICFLRLSSDRSQRLPRLFPTTPAGWGAGDFVLLDGAEQLGPLAWWHFLFQARRAGGVIITSHRPGRLPLLRRCETSPALLQELAVSLGWPLSLEASAALHSRHRGNLRAALRELYDRCASDSPIRVFSPPGEPAHSP